MKYYPPQEDEGGWAAAERDYAISLRAIWDALPPDLRLLCDRTPGWSPGRIFLNDSSVKKVEANFGGKTVEIVLAGEALDEDGRQTGERLFTLCYGEVQRFACAGEYGGDPPLALLHADHLWDEVELLGPGLFEHRMLFVSQGHIEMSVIFGQFRLTYTDRPHEAAA